MKENQMGAAMDMVVKEFNKLAMCKRGTLDTEGSKRLQELYAKQRSKPKINRKERLKRYKANRKKLMSCLKYKDSDSLSSYGDNFNHGTRLESIFTSDSIRKYKDTLFEIYKHKDYDAVVAHNKSNKKEREILREEMSQREAFLNSEVENLKLAFITGEIPMRNFSKEKIKFESTEF